MNNKARVVLLGDGDHALVIWDILHLMKNIQIEGYTSLSTGDGSPLRDIGLKCLGSDCEVIEKLNSKPGIVFLLALGAPSNSVRKKMISMMSNYSSFSFAAIHPKAVIADTAKIGHGTVVMAGAVVNPQAVIGSHCVINTGATVDHGVCLEQNVHIQPGAHLAGNVRVGENSVIGMGANIKEKIKIGKNCVIGGGAFVHRDVPEGETVVGVPARSMNSA